MKYKLIIMFLISLAVNLNAAENDNIDNNYKKKVIHQSVTIPNPYNKSNNSDSNNSNNTFNDENVFKNVNSTNKNIENSNNTTNNTTSDKTNSSITDNIVLWMFLMGVSCFIYKYLFIPIFIVILYLLVFKVED